MIAVLFISLQSYAQKKLKFGLKTGAGIASVTNSNAKELTLMFAYADGAMVNYSVSEVFSFQGELLFSKKGYAERFNLRDKVGMEYYTTTNRVSLYYIEIPLLVKVKTKGESLRLRFFANGGIAPAFHVASNARYNNGQNYVNSSALKVHTFDIGVIGSAGIEYNIATLPSFLELRINNGLSKISDNSNARNLTYMLSTGIFF